MGVIDGVIGGVAEGVIIGTLLGVIDGVGVGRYWASSGSCCCTDEYGSIASLSKPTLDNVFIELINH